MKMRLALLAVGALATMACIITLCSRPSGRITSDSYQKIRLLMTRQHVEKILGGPARNESANRFAGGYGGVSNGFLPEVLSEEWWGPDIAIFITFDAQDRVCSKDVHDARIRSAKFLGRPPLPTAVVATVRAKLRHYLKCEHLLLRQPGGSGRDVKRLNGKILWIFWRPMEHSAIVKLSSTCRKQQRPSRSLSGRDIAKAAGQPVRPGQ
jgi:hypothetical protein